MPRDKKIRDAIIQNSRYERQEKLDCEEPEQDSKRKQRFCSDCDKPLHRNDFCVTHGMRISRESYYEKKRSEEN